MRHPLLLLSLAALTIAASAQTTPDLGEVRIPGPSLRIELPAQYSRVWTGGFDTIKGSYDLSNGQELRLWMRGNRKYAQVGDMPVREVIATSNFEFVALDKQLKIVLTEPLFGDLTGHLLMVVPAKPDSTAMNMPEIRYYGFASK